jgi:hypothetical protein
MTKTYMHDVLEDLPVSQSHDAISIIAAIAFFLMTLIGGVLMVLVALDTAHADERPYVRWFVVAYFDGIDKKYTYVADPFTNSTECSDRVLAAKEENNIPSHITVGCKMWTAKPGDKS